MYVYVSVLYMCTYMWSLPVTVMSHRPSQAGPISGGDYKIFD